MFKNSLLQISWLYPCPFSTCGAHSFSWGSWVVGQGWKELILILTCKVRRLPLLYTDSYVYLADSVWIWQSNSHFLLIFWFCFRDQFLICEGGGRLAGTPWGPRDSTSARISGNHQSFNLWIPHKIQKIIHEMQVKNKKVPVVYNEIRHWWFWTKSSTCHILMWNSLPPRIIFIL